MSLQRNHEGNEPQCQLMGPPLSPKNLRPGRGCLLLEDGLLVTWLDLCLIELPGWCGSSSLLPLGGDLESSRPGVWGPEPLHPLLQACFRSGVPSLLAAASGGIQACSLCLHPNFWLVPLPGNDTEGSKSKDLVQPERPECKSQLHL